MAVVSEVCAEPVGPVLEVFSDEEPEDPAETVAELEAVEEVCPPDEEVLEEEVDEDPALRANPMARQSHVCYDRLVSELTDSAAVNIEDSIDVLQKGISKEPLATDDIISKHVARTHAVGHWGNPILGRDVVGNSGECESQRTRSSARHCPGVVIRGLRSWHEGVELGNLSWWAKDVRSSGVDISKPSSDASVLAGKAKTVHRNCPVSV